MDQHHQTITWVDSVYSPEFTHFKWALTRSSLIGLDAEWKPLRGQQSTFPTVSLLQIACRLVPDAGESTHQNSNESLVFLLDLASIHLPSIYKLLNSVFVSNDVIKLGFKFKQDLVYLSSTFRSQGCEPGFEKVEPFLDITSIYHYLHHNQSGRKPPKQNKSLATICKEVLGISLSKELQCSDWSLRPLTEEQKVYAAADAHCLLEIFDVFLAKVENEGNSSNDACSSNLDLGLKHILEVPYCCEKLIVTTISSEASDMVRATLSQWNETVFSVDAVDSSKSFSVTSKIDETLLKIVRKYGDKIVLKDSDKNPKRSKKKGKKSPSTVIAEDRQVEVIDNWQGPPPWDLSLGGDGCPKFLCDVMVEGLAKSLRCVGIDAAVPYSRKPATRDLIAQACKEKRVLLTRDAKLMRHEYLLKNQIYRVKTLLKNDQLLEIIETFQLKIYEDRLMSRCTKCNGMFIHKPLTTDEAVKAAKGFQKIPNCLFNKNLEFWQCMDCNQLYWEGTQYHNAVQKFINICKLNEGSDACVA